MVTPISIVHFGVNGLSILLRVLTLIALALVVRASTADAAGDPGRGREIFALAGGCGCHTPATGPVGSGGGEVPTPFGKFFGPNITPDPDTGLGNWSDAEIGAAIRDGYARGKGVEAPAMPYYWYAGITDGDLADLIAYLRSLPPVRRANREHEGEMPLARWAYRAWRLLFSPGFERHASAPTSGVALGRYLTDHVAICGDCHTPRSRLGSPRLAMYLAGTKHGPGDKPVPNLTPDKTGLATWDEADLLNLLKTGFTPEFDNVQGYMADVIDGHGGGAGYKNAPDAALRAIAAYLKTIRPIDNPVGDQ